MPSTTFGCCCLWFCFSSKDELTAGEEIPSGLFTTLEMTNFGIGGNRSPSDEEFDFPGDEMVAVPEALVAKSPDSIVLVVFSSCVCTQSDVGFPMLLRLSTVTGTTIRTSHRWFDILKCYERELTHKKTTKLVLCE